MSTMTGGLTGASDARGGPPMETFLEGLKYFKEKNLENLAA